MKKFIIIVSFALLALHFGGSFAEQAGNSLKHNTVSNLERMGA